ncbi:hypothetical protein ACHAXR_013496 [Thalassiosira sp. AJA248-18]
MNSLTEARISGASYSEIEASGPPVSPLGFPAPIVIYSDIVIVLCFDTSKSIWSEVNAILHQRQGREDIAYMLTSETLKQTICGEVVKGVILQRAKAPDTGAQCSINTDCRSMIAKYHDNNLWETTKDYVAIKVDRRKTIKYIHSKAPRNSENPWKEIACMQLLGNSHPNVMGLLGAFMDKQCLYEVMRFCSKGNLSSFIHHYPSGLSEHKVHELFLQILSGVNYIHSRGVCHHDLSTDNVMLYEDGRCVIIDFGMCLRVPYSYPDDSEGSDVTDITIGTTRRLIHSQNHCGKLRFMAPEIYQQEDDFDGFASDVWSLGVVLFVLLTGRQPYRRPDEKDPGYIDLVDPNFYWNLEIFNPCLSWGHEMSSLAIDLLRGMLRPDPRDRATLGWVLSHEWVAS